MAFLVKRADPKTALLNSVPAGEYAATLVGIGEPTHYGPSHKLKLPLRFQIDGYPSGVVLRRIRLVDHNGEPYAEFGPNTDMWKFLDVAGVKEPNEAIGMRFEVKVTRRGAFCDVVDVICRCSQKMYLTDVPHIPTPPVTGNPLVVTREWEPECTPQTYPPHTFTDKDKSADNSREGQSCPKNGQRPAAAQAVSRDIEIKNLIREIIFVSDGKATPQARHRVLLSDRLQNYSFQEIISAFKGFIEDKDLDDPRTQKFIVQDFLDAADGLCSMARRKKEERDREKRLRDQTVALLQAAAEQERAERREREKLVADFDPLAGE